MFSEPFIHKHVNKRSKKHRERIVTCLRCNTNLLEKYKEKHQCALFIPPKKKKLRKSDKYMYSINSMDEEVKLPLTKDDKTTQRFFIKPDKPPSLTPLRKQPKQKKLLSYKHKLINSNVSFSNGLNQSKSSYANIEPPIRPSTTDIPSRHPRRDEASKLHILPVHDRPHTQQTMRRSSRCRKRRRQPKTPIYNRQHALPEYDRSHHLQLAHIQSKSPALYLTKSGRLRQLKKPTHIKNRNPTPPPSFSNTRPSHLLSIPPEYQDLFPSRPSASTLKRARHQNLVRFVRDLRHQIDEKRDAHHAKQLLKEQELVQRTLSQLHPTQVKFYQQESSSIS